MFSVLESGLSTSLFVFLFSMQLAMTFNSELMFGSKIGRSNGLKRHFSLALADAMEENRGFLARIAPPAEELPPRLPKDPHCTPNHCVRVREAAQPSHAIDFALVAS